MTYVSCFKIQQCVEIEAVFLVYNLNLSITGPLFEVVKEKVAV